MNEKMTAAARALRPMTLCAILAGGLLAGCGGGDFADEQKQDAGAAASQDRSYVESLSKTKAPGQNFNLAPFTLQLPTGSADHPDTVSGSKLTTYTDSPWFYTNTSDPTARW